MPTCNRFTVKICLPFRTRFALRRGGYGWEIQLQLCLRTVNNPQPRYAPRPSSSSVGAPQEGAERARSSAPGQVCGSALPSPGQRSYPSCGDSSSSPAAEVGEAPKRYGQVPHRCKWLINVPDDYTLKIILTLCVEMLRK